jgi:hypothetical protein
MLAGLIGALVGVVGTSTGSVRWPGPTLAALALAVLLLLSSMQAWIRGQSYFMTFEEVAAQVTGVPGADPADVAKTRLTSHARLTKRYRAWVRRSQWAFQIGLSLFLVGLALVVLPPPHAAGATWRSLAAAAVLFVAIVGAALTMRRELKDARWITEISGGEKAPRKHVA